MKHVKSRAMLRVATLPIVAMAGLLSGHVLAAGTVAGTTVNNLATLTFAVGGTAQPVIGSSPTGNTTGGGTPTAFVVDRKLNVVVTTVDTAPVQTTLSNPHAVTQFNVTNSSNAVINIGLLANGTLATGTTGAGGTDSADFATGCSIYASAADAAAGNNAITKLTDVAQDAVMPVFVGCGIAASLAAITPSPANFIAAAGLINVDSLTATATGPTTQTSAGNGVGTNAASADVPYTQDTGADVATTVQNVFADTAGTVDADRDGKHSSNSAYMLTIPVLNLKKTETLVCDPLNGTTNPKHIPGALVRYTISVTNDATATAPATLTSVTDTLDAALTHDVNFVAGTDAATCVAGSAPTSGGAAGSGFRLLNTFVAPATASTERPAGPTYNTNGADTDVASVSGQNVTFDYSKLATGAAHTVAGQINPGETVTVEFQAFVK